MYPIRMHSCLFQEQSNLESDRLREYSRNRVPVEPGAGSVDRGRAVPDE